MLCPYCKKQTPVYRKACIHCGKDLSGISVGDLLSDKPLDDLEAQIDSLATERGYGIGERIGNKYVIKGLV